MRFLPNRSSLVVVCLAPLFASLPAAADDVVLGGPTGFAELDGSAIDADGAADGVFTVDGDLVVASTVECSDEPPLAGHAGGCPISIAVAGDLLLEAGGALLAENRRGGGDGGGVHLVVGGAVHLAGPAGALPGASISTAAATGGSSSDGGDVAIEAGGPLTLAAGSTIDTSSANGQAGAIRLAGSTLAIDGLVSAGPGRELTGNLDDGAILAGGGRQQRGGAIRLVASSSEGPALIVGGSAVIVSQGQTPGGGGVALAGCGIEIRGLVASLAAGYGETRVELRSGKGIVVDGRDFGAAVPEGRFGRIRADALKSNAAGFGVDLFAEETVTVHGPDPTASPLYAVVSRPGTQAAQSGGTLHVVSLGGSFEATGNALEAGGGRPKAEGGLIRLEAAADVVLAGAGLAAVGGTGPGAGNVGQGGSIVARAYQGEIAWTAGRGDVRPVGPGVASDRAGHVLLTACTAIDLAGTDFPPFGAATASFPVTAFLCGQAAPTLPSGSLPVCNRPPEPADDAYAVDEGATLVEPAPGVLGNDLDPDGDPMTAVLASGPAHAASFILEADGSFVYVHDGSETLTDSFTYRASDGSLESEVATVTIAVTPVNDAPRAEDDAYAVAEGGSLAVAAPGVLGDDADAEGDALSAVLVAGPSHAASFALHADGSFDYVHDGGETLADSFTYTASDGALSSNVATVTIEVMPVNDPPVADDDAYVVAEGETLTVAAPGVFDGDTDAEGDALAAELVSGPAHAASFALSADGGFTYVHDGSETVSDAFTYRASDGTDPSNVATVTISVTPVDDPPQAAADAAAVAEEAPNDGDAANNTATGDVLANDVDPDSALTVVAVAGSAAHVGVPVAGSHGTLTVAAGGGFTYVLDDADPAVDGLRPGETLSDAFAYTAGDGTSTAAATLVVTIHGANDPPAAAADAYLTVGNTQLAAGGAAGTGFAFVVAAANVLADDADPEGTALSVVPAAGATALGGSYAIAADGSFLYTPPTGVETAPGTPDGFLYTARDGDGAATTAPVAIAVADMVWYVHNDSGTPGVEGTSTDPFPGLAPLAGAGGAGDVDGAGEAIFVFAGDGGAYSGGIEVEDGQRLLGQGIDLVVGGHLLVPAGPAARVEQPSGAAVRLADVGGVVRGFELTSGDARAVEVVTTGAGGHVVTIADNVVAAAGAEGIAVEHAATGTLVLTAARNAIAATGSALAARTLAGSGPLELAVDRNTGLTAATASAVLVDGSAGGPLFVTSLDGNTIDGASAAGGLRLRGVVLDAVPGGAYETVAGGATAVGSPAARLIGDGIAFEAVEGDLAWTDLDVANQSGTGLLVTGGTAFTGGGGLRLVSGAGSTIDTAGGTALAGGAATYDLVFASLDAQGGTVGLDLLDATGSVAAAAGSLGGSSGTAVRVDAAAPTALALHLEGVHLAPAAGGGAALFARRTTGAVRLLGGTIAKSGGRVLELIDADGGGSFAGTTVTTTDHHGLRVADSRGPLALPALTIAAATPSPVDAVVLESNTGTLSLGTLDLATFGAGVRGLTANSGGDVSLAGSSSSITSVGGAALDVVSTGTGAGWTFASVSSTNSAAEGVRLVDVGGHVTIAGGAIGGAAGTAFAVSGGSGDVAYAGNLVNAAGRIVEVTGRSVAGRSVTFSGALAETGSGILVQGNSAGSIVFGGPSKVLSTGAATAILLHSNAGASIAFTGGGLDVDTTSGTGLHASGGGLLEIAGGGNTVDSLTGIAVRVEGASFGAGHATFERISAGAAASGPAHGIVVLDTGSLGGLRVTGSGAPGSGGLIRRTDSHGVLAQQTRFLELQQMVIGDPAAAAGQAPDAVNHVGGAGLALAAARDVRLVGVTVSRTAGHGIVGSGVDGLTIEGSAFLNNGDADGESALSFAGLALDPARLVGSVTISDTVVDGYVENGLEIVNSAGTLALTLAGTRFANNASLFCGGGSCGENGLLVRAGGTATAGIEVTGGSVFDGVDGNAIAVFTDAAGAAADVVVRDSTIAGSRAFGVVLFATEGSLLFEVAGNQITGTGSTAVSIQPNGGSTTSGTVAGNAISGSTLGRGIEVLADDAASAVVALLDNTVDETLFGVFVGTQGSAELAATVRGNRVRPLAVAPLRGGLAAHGIDVQSRQTAVQCLDLAGNDSLGADGGVSYRARQRDTSVFRLERFTGDGTDGAAVGAFLAAQNTPPSGQTGSATVSTTYTGVADGFCASP